MTERKRRKKGEKKTQGGRDWRKDTTKTLKRSGQDYNGADRDMPPSGRGDVFHKSAGGDWIIGCEGSKNSYHPCSQEKNTKRGVGLQGFQ